MAVTAIFTQDSSKKVTTCKHRSPRINNLRSMCSINGVPISVNL